MGGIKLGTPHVGFDERVDSFPRGAADAGRLRLCDDEAAGQRIAKSNPLGDMGGDQIDRQASEALAGKRCPDPTFRAGSGGGLMPAHERSI